MQNKPANPLHKIRGLLILGFGGHARAVADVALACNIKKFIFVDDGAREGENFFGHPVQKNYPKDVIDGWACMPAAGDGYTRLAQIDKAEKKGWIIATLIAPFATFGVGAKVETGSFIGQHAHIGPMASVGRGCIINTGAVIEHECRIGDYTHVSVNATIAGRSSIGDHVFIGAGATVINGLGICDAVTIGAGAVVTKTIILPGVYVGIPINPRSR